MNKLSAVLIVKNEETNLPRCLSALAWANEIVLVDTGSTDGTVRVAESLGCRVLHSEWLGFGRVKQFAVSQAAHDGVLVIDADEEVSDELCRAILALPDAPPYYAYRIRRRSFYLGRLIRYSGWQSDHTLRLFNRAKAAFNDKPVHESVQTTHPIGGIEAPLWHYTYPTLRSHLQKMDFYTSISAKALHEKGKRAGIGRAVLLGTGKFCKMYIVKQGFRDGREGLVLALMSSFGVFLKYIKLWELCSRS